MKTNCRKLADSVELQHQLHLDAAPHRLAAAHHLAAVQHRLAATSANSFNSSKKNSHAHAQPREMWLQTLFQPQLLHETKLQRAVVVAVGTRRLHLPPSIQMEIEPLEQ